MVVPTGDVGFLYSPKERLPNGRLATVSECSDTASVHSDGAPSLQLRQSGGKIELLGQDELHRGEIILKPAERLVGGSGIGAVCGLFELFAQ